MVLARAAKKERLQQKVSLPLVLCISCFALVMMLLIILGVMAVVDWVWLLFNLPLFSKERNVLELWAIRVRFWIRGAQAAEKGPQSQIEELVRRLLEWLGRFRFWCRRHRRKWVAAAKCVGQTQVLNQICEGRGFTPRANLRCSYKACAWEEDNRS